MNDIIYLLCVEKERMTGGVHYHPVINTNNLNDIDIACCNNLIGLQNDYYDTIESIRNDCEKVIIVPVSFETYHELIRTLKETTDKAQEALTNAYDALKEAYRIMGKDISLEQTISDRTKDLINRSSSAGKCLDEDLNITDCDSSYKNNYIDDFEEEEDYYDEDDEYDDEGYDDEE